MLYTRKGDKGDTYFFGCNQRFSKSSELAEALGAVDEINSLLGLCKVRVLIDADNPKAEQARYGADKRINADKESAEISIKISDISESLAEILEQVQQDLFIVQANLAGAKDKKITQEKIQYLEKIIDSAEKEMPPIKTFFLSGGTELSALFDYARAIARRAERRVVKLSEKDKIDAEILAYMNRLSSLLYALARFVNVKSGAEQIPPSYK